MNKSGQAIYHLINRIEPSTAKQFLRVEVGSMAIGKSEVDHVRRCFVLLQNWGSEDCSLMFFPNRNLEIIPMCSLSEKSCIGDCFEALFKLVC